MSILSTSSNVDQQFEIRSVSKENRSRLDEKANDCGMIVFLCELASSLIELA